MWNTVCIIFCESFTSNWLEEFHKTCSTYSQYNAFAMYVVTIEEESTVYKI